MMPMGAIAAAMSGAQRGWRGRLGNQAPTVGAGSDQSVAAGAAVTMTASASDADGSISTYAWAKLSGTASPTLSGASTSSCTFTAPSAGSIDTLVYRCTVTDNLGATAFDDIQITVAATGGGSGPAPYAPYFLNVTTAKIVTFSESDYLANGTSLIGTNPPTTYTLWHSTTSGQAYSGGTGATSYTVSASGVTVSGIPSGAAYFTITATNSVAESENSTETASVTIT